MNRYTKPAIVLHWMVAILMVVNVLLIWSVDLIPEDWVRPAIDTHKSIGVSVLGLALMRLLWRFSHRPPELEVKTQMEKLAAHFAHGVLYLLMIAIPVTGWLHDSAWKAAAEHPMQWFGLFEWPRIAVIMNKEPSVKEHLHDLFGNFHSLLGWVLCVLFVLHVAGALKHQFVDKQRQLQRMWFNN